MSTTLRGPITGYRTSHFRHLRLSRQVQILRFTVSAHCSLNICLFITYLMLFMSYFYLKLSRPANTFFAVLHRHCLLLRAFFHFLFRSPIASALTADLTCKHHKNTKLSFPTV